MAREGKSIQIDFTEEEALALFVRCLNSTESDSPAIVEALRKLGRAIQGQEEILLAS